MQFELTDQNSVTDGLLQEARNGETDINLYTKIRNCQNFDGLRILFSSEQSFAPLVNTVATLSRQHRIDTDALQYRPKDAPKEFLPVEVFGDGNCFT